MLSFVPKRYYRNLGIDRKTGMDDLWDRLLTGTRGFHLMDDGEWLPATDIDENDKHVIITAELPGIDPDDIDVSVSGDLVTIKGEKKMEEETNKVYERYFGSFERSFRLPAEVSGHDAEADFKNGVLKITLPKLENTSRKSIEIKSH